MNGILLAIAIISSIGWLASYIKQRRIAKDHRRIEDEIELIQNSIRTIGAGTFYYNIQKDASYWDARSKEIFGFPDLPDPIPPGFWESRVFEEDRERVIDGAIQLLSDKDTQIMSHEYRICLPSGEIRWVGGTGYLRRDHEGSIIESFGFHFDLTNQKRYEQALLRERQRAVSGMLAKTQFLANMSHEIRTPMNAIIGLIELLDEQSLNSVQRSYLSTLKNSGNVLMRIVNDILDLSKMEAGKLHLEMKPFDLKEAVTQCLSVYTQESDSKNIFLAAHLDSRLPNTLTGDSIRLQQALLNLLGNAFKFTQEGSILLTISLADQQTMRVEVKDTGSGIQEKHLTKLFERFEQGAEDISNRFGGSGLGLTIIKNIVELWQGKVGVDSVYGQGSTFWFELPIKEPSKAIKTSNKGNILVCSRFDELAQLWTLDPNAPNVTFARDAEAFKQLFAQQQFDQVIVEQRARNGHGPDLLKWVKEQSESAFTTLIGYEKYVGDCSDLPFIDRYCSKPYILQDLWSKSPKSTALAAASTHDQIPNEFRELSVLVVDDVETNLMVIKGLLKRLGIKADSCIDGSESIAQCKSKAYDLILMDYEMPVLSGPEAAIEILKIQPTIIVGLSAHVGTEFVNACFEAGMVDYLSKPVNSQRLTALLSKHFPSKQEQPLVKEG
ncbi:ATP-binding protein [Reinekea marina]|uniref:histidine kinase n=1 Tax=Reinekea marina TaxID=1310421 RepID=A0ABV7WXC7_9GAMM|nr:PAS domain-containing hybrid sensor histidine kinase/response regulator [Reinekea marina]MDN3647394.1 ATP-binding protein [Reinekea marina]